MTISNTRRVNAVTLLATIFPDRDLAGHGLEHAIQKELLIEALRHLPHPKTVSELFLRLAPTSGFGGELRVALRHTVEHDPELSLRDWVQREAEPSGSSNGKPRHDSEAPPDSPSAGSKSRS